MIGIFTHRMINNGFDLQIWLGKKKKYFARVGSTYGKQINGHGSTIKEALENLENAVIDDASKEMIEKGAV